MRMLIPVFLVVLMTISVDSQDGPSHDSEFLHQPDNMTVPEGDQAILKCKVVHAVQRCRWYYLQEQLDFFDGRVNPVMVKDFKPKNPQDCTIKLKRVRKLQEGQWLCQALQIHRSHFTNSKPATLKVVTEEEAEEIEKEMMEKRREELEDETEENGAEFLTREDDYIQNTYLGAEITLDCLVNVPLTTCSWVMPHGNVVHYLADLTTNKTGEVKQEYGMKGKLSEGNCSLTIHDVRQQDEGNWHCLAQVMNEKTQEIDTLEGPVIHLHMMHLSHAAESIDVRTLKSDTFTITLIMVIVSLILLITLALVIYCLYTRRKSTKDEKQNIIPHGSVSENNYSHNWINSLKMPTKEHLPAVPKNLSDHLVNYTDLNHYNQYLDMTGSTNDGYIVMPDNRSSTSTVQTVTTDRPRTFSSATTMSTLSNNSNISNMKIENILFAPPPPTNRPASLYSTGHLYEEIPEKQDKQDIQQSNMPMYSNLLEKEDSEGYLIPNKMEKANRALHSKGLPKNAIIKIKNDEVEEGKAPAYCQVGEVPEPNKMVVNMEYDFNDKTCSNKLLNYDVPRGSMDSLASSTSLKHPHDSSYDVPRPTSTTATVMNKSNKTKVDISHGGIPGTIV